MLGPSSYLSLKIDVQVQYGTDWLMFILLTKGIQHTDMQQGPSMEFRNHAGGTDCTGLVYVLNT